MFALSNRFLKRSGLLLAQLWCLAFAFVMLFAFPVAGFFASVLVGFLLSQAIGIGIWLTFPFALLVGVYMSAYVWEPHLKPTMNAAFTLFRGKLD